MTLPATSHPNPTELAAMTLLREIRECGAFVLLDLEGTLHVQHFAGVPRGLEARLTFHYPQIVRLLLESVE